MAPPKTASWTKFVVMLGNGASPEVFSAPCVLTGKTLGFSADVRTQSIPDCAAPDEASWAKRTVTRLSAQWTGSGILATTYLETWRAWYESAAEKNCRVKLDVAAADGGGYWHGAFVLTGFEVGGGENDGEVTISVTAQSSGAVEWTDAT